MTADQMFRIFGGIFTHRVKVQITNVVIETKSTSGSDNNFVRENEPKHTRTDRAPRSVIG